MSVMSYNGAAIIGMNLYAFFFRPHACITILIHFSKNPFPISSFSPTNALCLLTEMRLLNALILIILLTHKAMCGHECVAIASDNRLGINQQQTTAIDFQKIFQIHPRLFLAMSGLASDMHTLKATFEFKHKLYELRENRVMEPKTFASVVSTTLYEKRFGPYYVEPVIAGLDKASKPYITGMDLIGAAAPTENFVVAGNNSESLFGVCESMYKENLEPEELFEVISQCLLSGSGRDCLSGWGGTVYVITKDGVEVKSVKGRMD